MKRLFLIIVWLTVAFRLFAQENYVVMKPNGLNSPNDDLASGLMEGKLIVSTSDLSDLVNDYNWHKNSFFHLELFTRGTTFNEWKSHEQLFAKKGNYHEGTATYSYEDSVLYFSSAKNYGKAKGTNIKIYSSKFTSKGWSAPVVLPFCDAKFDYTHPSYDPSRHLLTFSSNKEGGAGKMDLWFTYKLDIGWSEVTNVGGMVNTAGNEIFPSVFMGDIYYSTDAEDGFGGYDIRKALRAEQWKSFVALPEPINSKDDDLSIFFISEEKGFFSSNRKGGLGGDNIYVFQKKAMPEDQHRFTARLFCDSLPSNATQVTVTNALKEIVIEAKTDSTGKINIEQLQLRHYYRLQLSGIDPALFTHCVLHLYDATGVKVRELRFNAGGFIELELLDLNYADLKLMRFEDQSLLTINIEGQIFDSKPGDLGRGEPVTILDDKGNPVAIAYTNDTGKFRFNKVKPQEEYVLRLSEGTRASQMLILERGEAITLPVLSAEVNYQRTDHSEAIELVNEFDETIYVSPKDIFIINRIYYEYNSARLTGEANAQLDQLQLILAKNDHLKLELKSHTDSRGGDDYNLMLSRRRAESAVAYLSAKGISKSRFKAVGMGETQLLNECDDGVNCSDPEHSINRRTEIRLIKN